MTFSTLVATDYFPPDDEPTSTTRTVTFRADERYSMNFGVVDADDLALPDGKDTIFISAGQSITSLDVSGSLISIPGGDSADRQLFNDLHLLAKRTMGLRDAAGEYIEATLTLVLNNNPASQVILQGWIRDFVADRDAPEGLVEVKITFNFLLKDDPDISGLV